jgi:hypothetical protein
VLRAEDELKFDDNTNEHPDYERIVLKIPKSHGVIENEELVCCLRIL